MVQRISLSEILARSIGEKEFSEDGINETVEDDQTSAPTEKRHYPRYELRIPLRFMFSDSSEHVGGLLNISANGMALSTNVCAEMGAHTIIYVNDLGRFEGKIVRVLENGFAVEFLSGKHKRQRTLEILDCVVGDKKKALIEKRRCPRTTFEPGTVLRCASGQIISCEVVDLSLNGACLEMDDPPNVGEIVQIGRMRANVIRRLGRNIGIEFIGPEGSPEQ